jgi:hypothetical protein
MTHDELLAKIKPTLTYSPNAKFGAIPILNALRAVVEFHKPVPWDNGEGDSGIFCPHCPDEYPCPTIQAIEKEL